MGLLDIPEDAYPWSKSSSSTGLPDWGLDYVRRVGGRVPGLMEGYESSINNMAQAPALIDKWQQGSQDKFLGTLSDPLNGFMARIRKPMETLAGRGMFGGTQLRDSMTNLGGLLADDYRDYSAELGNKGLELKSQNLVDVASARGKAASVAAGVLGMGQQSQSSSYQENQWARWSDLLNLLVEG